MKLSTPKILLAAVFLAFLAPSTASAQIGYCSDSFCQSVPPTHLCLCEHCPGALVECFLRFTCPSESANFLSPMTDTPGWMYSQRKIEENLGATDAQREPRPSSGKTASAPTVRGFDTAIVLEDETQRP